MKAIDDFLNRITMYRLALWTLGAFIAAGLALSALGALPFRPLDLAVSVSALAVVSWIANRTFAAAFGAQINVESTYITALILALIITPAAPAALFSPAGLPFFIWAAVWAMASKFIFAWRKQHVWNPAAFAVALTAFALNQQASWWVGTLPMLPFTLAGGFLIVRKTLRADLTLSFLAAAFAAVIFGDVARGTASFGTPWNMLADTPIVFFASVMLTEPLTTPPTRPLRIFYGILVGALFSPMVHLGSVYSTPELALLAGNAVSFALNARGKYLMTLKEKIRLAPDIYEFAFAADRAVKFRPGQYLEWTLGHARPDSRGNRRYFTVASSPAENLVRLGVKFYPNPSSFKKTLLAMEPGGEIFASQRAGDFVLPRDARRKLAFLAGGIGITPYRSMARHLLDKGERRDISMIYSANGQEDLAYRDFLEKAKGRIGMKISYTLTDPARLPPDWRGGRGFLDAGMIAREIPDWRERTFYVSGPRSFVVAAEGALRDLGVPYPRIKKDFFPGFA